MAIHHCPHCSFESSHKWVVKRHKVSKHMDSPQQFLELHNSSQSKNRQIAGRGMTLEEIYSMAYDSFCKFIGYIKNITRKYENTQSSRHSELLDECLTYCGYSRKEIERVQRIIQRRMEDFS